MTIKLKTLKFEISFYFAAAVTLLLLFDKSGRAALGIAAAVIHEAGHLFCLLRWGDIPSKISLLPFGMRIERRGSVALSYNQEAAAALAGPAVNLILAAALTVIYAYTHYSVLLFPIAINLGLGLLNLMPIEPLDGGRILHALLLKRLSEQRSEQIAVGVSVLFLFPLAFAGFYVLIRSGYNFTLLAVTVYLVLLLILKK